ncbi:MAG: hypothetical protein R3C26_11525 [Calditrichia bacterium]
MRKNTANDDEMFDFIPDEINRLNRLVNDFAIRKAARTAIG